jgi:SAM-dependent methyltransferase
MGYFEWHERPGYYADVTRHFDPDEKILDVGCGSAWLADDFRNYTGVDSSLEAVEQARARGRNVVHADIDKGLPFADASFDAAILKDVLEHVDNPVTIVHEVRRVVKPGGRVFASSPDAQRWVWHDYTHRRPFTRRAYRLLFADAGFEVERVGYESVVPGTGVVSGWTRKKRRPLAFRVIAWVPWVRRNVWLLARTAAVTPAEGSSVSRSG